MKGKQYLETESLFCGLVRSPAVQTEVWDRVDVIYDQVEIPLGQVLKARSLRQDLSEFCMRVFNAAFLSASHWITVIDACSLKTIFSGFQCLRVTKFTTSVCQDRFEDDVEGHGSEPVFDPVKYSADGSLGTAVQKICEKQLLIPEVKRQDAFL